MKKLGSRGGIATQENRTLEEKKLHSQRMNDAKRAKRLRMLTDHSALEYGGSNEALAGTESPLKT